MKLIKIAKEDKVKDDTRGQTKVKPEPAPMDEHKTNAQTILTKPYGINEKVSKTTLEAD